MQISEAINATGCQLCQSVQNRIILQFGMIFGTFLEGSLQNVNGLLLSLGRVAHLIQGRAELDAGKVTQVTDRVHAAEEIKI